MTPAQEVHDHLAQVREVGDVLGIGFLGLGVSPKWTRAEIPIMPKGRYEIMAPYMDRKGGLGRDMMFRSCTVQVNLDFSSEADMVKKLRVGLALQPVITALFANSPFLEGRPNGFKTFRAEIWRDTDPDRTGMLPFAFESGMGFERYVDYALDVPMYFVYRDGRYHDVAGESFRDFLAGRLPGPARRAADPQGLVRSSDHHLSRSAVEEVSRDARRRFRSVAEAVRAARPFGSDCSMTRHRSTAPGTWSRNGRPTTARNCATPCRARLWRPASVAAACAMWRATC